MDHHHLPAGGRGHHAVVVIPQPSFQAPHVVPCRGGACRAWLAHYDRRSCVPGHSHCPCDSGHGFRCGHAVDDQHHPGAVSSFENRPIDGRRIAGHYRGSGHRPDRRRRGDHSAAVARDFRHRHSAGANRSMPGRFKMHRTASPDGRGTSQFVAVRVDCACIVWIGAVPKSSWSVRQLRGFRQ